LIDLVRKVVPAEGWSGGACLVSNAHVVSSTTRCLKTEWHPVQIASVSPSALSTAGHVVAPAALEILSAV
jgi:hypothetical protein